MSFPGEGIQALYRNSLTEVCRFLTEKHGRLYMIWNLSEFGYDYKSFDNRIIDSPFPDHHAPPLDLLFNILATLDSWMKSPDNVAVLHCMGGKGRTGTVIICYLYFSQIRPFDSIQAARTLFAQKRSKIEKGIIQPSQIRYVDYFADILEGTADCEPRAMTIDQIQMRRMPDKVKSSGELLHIEIYDYTSTASVLPNDAPMWASYDEANEDKYNYDEAADIATVRINLAMSGDILIRGVVGKGKKKKHLFLLTLNTSFIDTTSGRRVMKFMRKDLDLAFKDKKHGFDDQFQVDLTVLPAPNFGGKLQETTTWCRTRDRWQAQNPSLVKKQRAPLPQSASAVKASQVAMTTKLATASNMRTSMSVASTTTTSTSVVPALSSSASLPLNERSANWIAGDSLRRQQRFVGLQLPNQQQQQHQQQQSNAASLNSASAPNVLLLNSGSSGNNPASPTPGMRSNPERRMTMTKITMHVVGPDDDPQHDDEELFEFDVDDDTDGNTNSNSNTTNSDMSNSTGSNNANVEIQWLNSKSFNELDDIESQVARMQQDMVNATLDLERMMSEGSNASTSSSSTSSSMTASGGAGGGNKTTISPSSTPSLSSQQPRFASPTPQQRNNTTSPSPSPRTHQPQQSQPQQQQQQAPTTATRPLPKPTPSTGSTLTRNAMSPTIANRTNVAPAPAAATASSNRPLLSHSDSYDTSIIEQLAATVGVDLGASSTSSTSTTTTNSSTTSKSTTRAVVRGPGNEDLSAFAWYRHEVNRDMAEELLADGPVGSFLVRPSSQPACLALSHRQPNGSVGHMLLRYWNVPTRRGYSKESEPETYATVDDLLHSLPLVFEDESMKSTTTTTAANLTSAALSNNSTNNANSSSPTSAAAAVTPQEDDLDDMTRFF